MSTGDLYSQHAADIEDVLAYVRRNHRLSPDDGDDFSSVARLKLIEHEFHILRQFKGESSFKTYIVVVISRLFLDWRNSRWGRWRPSAEAKRLGPVATELERLVLRDARPYDEAVELLMSKGVETTQAECDRIWARLKKRSPREFVEPDEVEDLPVGPVDPVADEQRRQRAIEIRDALHKVQSALPPGDQLIVKLRMESGFTVARIAKLQGVDQKALYRRFDQIFKQMRLAMQSLGISEDDSDSFFGQFGDDDDVGPLSGNGGMRPSILPSAGGAV